MGRMRKPESLASRERLTNAAETEYEEHTSETTGAPSTRREPQRTSGANTGVEAARPETGHGNDQQPGGQRNKHAREAPKLHEKGHEKNKTDKGTREDNGVSAPEDKPGMPERRLKARLHPQTLWR